MMEPLYYMNHWYMSGPQRLPVYSREVLDAWKEEATELLNKIAAGLYTSAKCRELAYEQLCALGPENGEECGTESCFYVEEIDGDGETYLLYECELEEEFTELATTLERLSGLSIDEEVELDSEGEKLTALQANFHHTLRLC